MAAIVESKSGPESDDLRGDRQPPVAPARITSMDQFRGYTVFGMFLVNFLGGFVDDKEDIIRKAYDWTYLLNHNGDHFSYADSIMPSFMFAAGFSFRLSMLKRLARGAGAYSHAIRRSLALILVSLVIYAAGDLSGFSSWGDVTWANAGKLLAHTLKADLWEVLAIIGAAQLLLLPVIARSAWVRFATLLAFLATHVVISHFFNYDFVNGRPNWMDSHVFFTEDKTAWDGGFFGLLMWSVPMLAGSLVYDLSGRMRSGGFAAVLIVTGALVMGLGYASNCLTRAYDVAHGEPAGDNKLAQSPVLPDFSRLKDRPLADLLAEPPFIRPPDRNVRKFNYWFMDKQRALTLPFIAFATGFALALYALFVIACDVLGLSWGVFRILGMNALAAYVIHHAVGVAMGVVTPEDSAPWWVLLSLVVFYLVTLLIVKFLDDRKLYIRL